MKAMATDAPAKPGSVAEAIAVVLGRHLLHTCGQAIHERGDDVVSVLQREAKLELAVRGLDHWQPTIAIEVHRKRLDVLVVVTRRTETE